MTGTPTLQLVAVDDILPHPDNPRRMVGDVSGLASSIKAVGILQALVLHQNDDGTVNCMLGHRRRLAAKEAGLSHVPASVWTGLSADQQFEMMVAENVVREDLSPVEEAYAFESMRKRKISQRAIAERMGCDQSHVSRRLELLKFTEEDQELVHEGKLTVSKALKSLKPKPEKAPAPEPIEVPAAMLPDPIDPLEPIGYGVVAFGPDGEIRDELGQYFLDAEQARFFAQEELMTNREEVASTIPVALVPLPPIQVDSESVGAEPSPPEGEVTEEGEEEGPSGAVAEDNEVAAPLVTISPPEGQYNQHIVTCSIHKRMGGFQQHEKAVEAADRHVLLSHPGQDVAIDDAGAAGFTPIDELPAVEDYADEPDPDLKTRLVEFGATWAKIGAATEETVRESAVHEFGNQVDVDRAMSLYSMAKSKLAKAS